VTGLGGRWLASMTARFPGGIPERGSYLGLPVLLMIALLVLRRRRSPPVLFLLAAFGVATFLTLGTALYVNGHRLVWLPWSLLSHTTGFEDMLPSRFAVYASLAVAVMVALWISSTPGRFASRPVVLPALAVVALVPPFWRGTDVFHPQRWAFFSDKLYKVCIPRGETLMVFPFGRWGESTLWQAESGFWFKIAAGTLGHNNQPKTFVSDPTVSALVFENDPSARPSMDQIHALAARRHVDRILSVAQNDPYPDGTEMRAFGEMQELGNVFVAPACGYRSLAGDTRPPP
jgi:hypothetical protein